MRRLIEFFVDNYVLTFSVFGALVLFGIISAFGLGLDLQPEIEIPIVAVATVYPGGGPEEISRQINEPIEGQLATLPGITSVSSSASEGFSFVIAQFSSDVSVDDAAIDVSGRVNAIAAALPEGAQTPTVQKFDPADQPILSVAVSAPGADLSEVQKFAEDELQPTLRRVDGVADVSVVGPSARQIQVLLNPAELASYGLSPSAVTGAITASAVDISAGTLTVGDNRLVLAGRATPSSLRAIGDIRVDSSRGIRVSDVATVRDSSEIITTYARLGGEPVVLMEVRKLAGGNSVEAANGVRKALTQIVLPAGYSTEIVGDNSIFIAASVKDTLVEMALATLAVSLIVLLFTGRLGSVLAVILAIPVSISGALIIFNLFDFTFNIVTLLALTVAIGLVVDDAIVVAENIDRYREESLSRRESVLKGAGQVSTAVLAATMSLLAVFLPISFLPGIIGQFFREFGLTLAAAVTFSYFEAMFFLTVRLALSPDPLPPGWRDLGKAGGKLGRDIGWGVRLYTHVRFWVLLVVAAGAVFYAQFVVAKLPLPTAAIMSGAVLIALPLLLFVLCYVGRLILFFLGAIALTLYRLGNWGIDHLRNGYVRALRFSLGHAWVVLLAAGLLFASLFVAFPRIGFNFQPPDDSGLLNATLDLPSSTALDETNRLAGMLERRLLSNPEIKTVQTTVGSGDIFGTPSSNQALYTLQLVPKDERDLDTTASAVAIERDLREVLRNNPEAELTISNAASGPTAGTGYSLAIGSSDLTLLRERSDAALKALETVPGLRNATSDLASTNEERVFNVDPAKLDGTGLTNQEIFGTLLAYNVGGESGKLRQGGSETPIWVRGDPAFITDEQSLLSLPILAPGLESTLPLSSLGSFSTSSAPATLNRLDQSYSATLSADLAPGANLQQVTAAVETKLTNQGILDNRVTKLAPAFDFLGDLVFYAPIAFGLALLLNYLAIGSQFNSFKYPLYLLLTVPLALVGALWLFVVTGTALDIISVLGVVMLIGLVTKNAILLLDVTLQEVKEGTSLRQALLTAGAVRFRPILMTTATVVVISIPLLLGIGEGSEFRYPLGLVIVGGVLTSALLTFFVVPAAFFQFEHRHYDREQEARRAKTVVIAPPPRTVNPALSKS